MVLISRYHGLMMIGKLPPLLLAPLAALLLAAAPIEAPSIEKQLAAAASLVDANKSDEALVLLDAMLATTYFPAEIGQIEGLRSFALARANRIAEAHKAIEASIARSPAPSMLLLRQLFLLRAFDGDPKGAGDSLLLIAATDPKGLNALPTEVVTDVLRAARGDNNRAFELDYALVTAGWSPPDTTLSELDDVRERLIAGLMTRGRLLEAKSVLAAVLNPAVLLRLGIDRRYAALWPEIEKQLGPTSQTASAAYVAAAKARFDKAPTSLIARLGYAQALNIAAREPEAMLVANAAKSPEALAALTDREVWLVNLDAALLGDAGKIDEALARLAALTAVPTAARPGMAATVVNEVMLAQSLGRSEAALTLADAASKHPALNDYALLYLAQARTCALAELGRKDKAVAAAVPLVGAPSANNDAYLAAMICLGRLDAAAAAIIKQLASPEDRAAMLFDLQPFLIGDRPTPRDVLHRAGLRALRQRPDVKAAFLKAGRDLPAAVSPPR